MAVQQALDLGVDRIERRLQHLASMVRKGLATVPGVTVRDHGRRLCAICSFTKVCRGSEAVVAEGGGVDPPESSLANSLRLLCRQGLTSASS